MIHVCYGLYDKSGRYTKFVGTSMLSMFENAIPTPPPWITVHILHDNTLSEENHDKLVYVAGRYGQQIKFYNVEKLFPEKISEIKNKFASSVKRVSIGSIFRLFMPKILPEEIEKIIYLDADTVVNLNINEFWQIDLGDKVLAAVPETLNGTDSMKLFALCLYDFVKPEDYFNAGVLVINLKRFRQELETVEKATDFVAANPNCTYFDQDILNYCFSNDCLKLPNKFNYFKFWNAPTPGETVGKKIYHYPGLALQFNFQSPFNQLWFKYFCKTPWLDENTFEHISDSLKETHDRGKNLALQTAKLLSGKSRGFFVNGANVEAVRNIFAVSADEEIISDSVEDLIQSMKTSQGKKVFFILLMNFQEVANILVQAGFVYGRDFVNGFDFLATNYGTVFDTNPIVLNL